MARTRLISPDAPLDEAVARCSLAARLVWAYLPCHADREGRLRDDAFRLKQSILPVDHVDMQALLGELVRAGLVYRYAVEARGYLQIRSFHRYQHPHVREPASTIPAPPRVDTGTPPADGDRRTLAHTVGQSPGKPVLAGARQEQASLDPDSGSGDGSGSGDPPLPPSGGAVFLPIAIAPQAAKRPPKRPSQAAKRDADFAAWYAEYLRKMAPADAEKAWRQTAAQRPELGVMLAILRRQNREDFSLRPPDRVPYPASYLRGAQWQNEPVTRAGAMLTDRERRGRAATQAFLTRMEATDDDAQRP